MNGIYYTINEKEKKNNFLFYIETGLDKFTVCPRSLVYFHIGAC